MIPIVSIVGRKNSGKTTLIEGVIPELKKKGYRVGTIKHSIHHNITIDDVDHKGKDTYRHYQAGADVVVLSAAEMTAIFKRRTQPEIIDQLVASYPSAVDLILAEGFKQEGLPKIEIVRQEIGQELICNPQKDNLIAVVSVIKFEVDIPCFVLNAYKGIADFLEQRFLSLMVDL